MNQTMRRGAQLFLRPVRACRWRWIRRNIFVVLAATSAVIFYCEYLIYYVALWGCRWPRLACAEVNGVSALPLHAMVLADVHMLSPWAHWLDKLRREWQMFRSFQTAMALMRPEVVFVLGDILDKGLRMSSAVFSNDVARFRRTFAVPDDVPLICAAGNHDMGFHYEIYPETLRRFEATFGTRSVLLYTMKDVDFVVLNSMAFEGDACEMCAEAETMLKNVSRVLKKKYARLPCASTEPGQCPLRGPVVMQHFPLYRKSDEICPDDDDVPDAERSAAFRPKWECLSREASDKVLDMLAPRAVFGGHTHHSCQQPYRSRNSSSSVPEWTISSFNWRNKNNPSFLAVALCPSQIEVVRCPLPQESTTFLLYSAAGALLALYLVISWTLLIRHRSFKLRLS